VNYLTIGHDQELKGECWFWEKGCIISKKNTEHVIWRKYQVSSETTAMGRIDRKKGLTSIVYYGTSLHYKEYIMKQLQKKFLFPIVDCSQVIVCSDWTTKLN